MSGQPRARTSRRFARACGLGDAEHAKTQIREILNVLDKYRDLGPQTDLDTQQLVVDSVTRPSQRLPWATRP